eukprot:1616979-Amphidinium_carterae.1
MSSIGFTMQRKAYLMQNNGEHDDVGFSVLDGHWHQPPCLSTCQERENPESVNPGIAPHPKNTQKR